MVPSTPHARVLGVDRERDLHATTRERLDELLVVHPVGGLDHHVAIGDPARADPRDPWRERLHARGDRVHPAQHPEAEELPCPAPRALPRRGGDGRHRAIERAKPDRIGEREPVEIDRVVRLDQLGERAQRLVDRRLAIHLAHAKLGHHAHRDAHHHAEETEVDPRRIHRLRAVRRLGDPHDLARPRHDLERLHQIAEHARLSARPVGPCRDDPADPHRLQHHVERHREAVRFERRDERPVRRAALDGDARPRAIARVDLDAVHPLQRDQEVVRRHERRPREARTRDSHAPPLGARALHDRDDLVRRLGEEAGRRVTTHVPRPVAPRQLVAPRDERACAGLDLAPQERPVAEIEERDQDELLCAEERDVQRAEEAREPPLVLESAARLAERRVTDEREARDERSEDQRRERAHDRPIRGAPGDAGDARHGEREDEHEPRREDVEEDEVESRRDERDRAEIGGDRRAVEERDGHADGEPREEHQEAHEPHDVRDQVEPSVLRIAVLRPLPYEEAEMVLADGGDHPRTLSERDASRLGGSLGATSRKLESWAGALGIRAPG